MASNPGEILISGFNAGLGIRRNIEETAKLVREREMNEQADQLWKEAMAANQQITDKLLSKQTELTKILDTQRAGGPVDRTRIGVLNQEIGRMAEENIALMQQQAVRLMQSGNPVAMERAQTILASAVDIQGKIAAQQQHVFDRNAEEENNQANRNSAEGIAAANRQSAEKIAAGEQAGATQRTGMQIDSAERINTQDNATSRANTQTASDTQVTVAGMGIDDARKAREQQDAQFQAELKFRRSQVETPAKKMSDLLEVHKYMRAFKELGYSNEEINKMPGIPKGFTAEQFEATYSAVSEDLAKEMQDTEALVSKLQKRLDKGDKVGPQLQRAQEYLKQLQVYEDQKTDAEIEASQFALDAGAAEEAGAAFGKGFEHLGNVMTGVITAPFHFGRGLVAGPSARQSPEKEARDISKGKKVEY